MPGYPDIWEVQSNDHTLSELLKLFSANPKLKPKLYQKKIEAAWLEVAGRWINNETQSIRLNGTVLTIYVESPALRQELHFSKDKILKRVNETIGEEYVKSVVIK